MAAGPGSLFDPPRTVPAIRTDIARKPGSIAESSLVGATRPAPRDQPSAPDSERFSLAPDNLPRLLSGFPLALNRLPLGESGSAPGAKSFPPGPATWTEGKASWSSGQIIFPWGQAFVSRGKRLRTRGKRLRIGPVTPPTCRLRPGSAHPSIGRPSSSSATGGHRSRSGTVRVAEGSKDGILRRSLLTQAFILQ